MTWLEGLRRNWAELAPDARDPRLRPFFLPLSHADALRRAAEILERLPRWSIVAIDPASGTLHATRTSRIWRFVDEIYLTFEPDPHGTRITGRSQARIGRIDFGQNARNLRELAEVLSSES